MNLIKAAIKQRFICLGLNLPHRRHVTAFAAHTCRVRVFPGLRARRSPYPPLAHQQRTCRQRASGNKCFEIQKDTVTEHPFSGFSFFVVSFFLLLELTEKLVA